jgi:hypothetical protein
LEED